MKNKNRLTKEDRKQLEKLFTKQLTELYKKDNRKTRFSKNKKPVVKKAIKVSTYKERGSNRKTIVLPNRIKSVDQIVEALESLDWKKTFKVLMHKNKPDGKHYKPPQSVVLIFMFKRGKEKFYQSVYSPHDFIVDFEPLKQFTIEQVRDLEKKWEVFEVITEDLEELSEYASGDVTKLNPLHLKEITVSFYYGLNR